MMNRPGPPGYAPAWQSRGKAPPGFAAAAMGPRAGVVAVIPHRSKADWQVLQATLFLAFLLHTVAIFTMVVLNPKVNSEDYKFFPDVKRIDVGNVTMEKIVEAPPKPPPAVAKPTPIPKAMLPFRPQVAAPAAKALAPTRTSGARRPGPNVLAAKGSHGVPMRQGGGGGSPNGRQNSYGTGGNGTGTGTGSGGTAMAPPPPGPPPGEAVTSFPTYQSASLLQDAIHTGVHPSPEQNNRVPECRTWEQLARALGLDIRQIRAAAQVPPYFINVRNPTLGEQDSLHGKVGQVSVHVTLSASGKPRPEILQAGDPNLDKVAYKLACDTVWLPALKNGQPVEGYTFDYEVVFQAR